MRKILENPVVRERLYTLFKYTIYLLLIWNTYLFFRQDWAASSHTFHKGISYSQIMEAFTASADTLNWVILLLLFELETWVISDKALQNKSLKWGLMFVRTLCYSLIVYAFYGYLVKLTIFYGVTPLSSQGICSMVDGIWARVNTLDEYQLLSDKNCQNLRGMELFKLHGQQLIADVSSLQKTRLLAWTDVINSGAWLGVVIILEVDVWFQLKGLLEGTLLRTSKIIKIILYITLIFCAVAWGVLGDFLAFWDAFLWLLAFAFIEMNLFQWQQETIKLELKVPDTLSTPPEQSAHRLG